MNRKWYVFRDTITLIYTLGVTFLVSQWGFAMAYAERGYEAIGGEYVMIPMAAWLAYKTITKFFDEVEEWMNEQYRKRYKARSRRNTRMRDNRGTVCRGSSVRKEETEVYLRERTHRSGIAEVVSCAADKGVCD